MSTAKVASISPDQRNLQWKSNNFGAKLMGKMGWKDGEAVGKRQRVNGAQGNASSEGLRITKRVDGLGVGAEKVDLCVSDVSKDFNDILASLNSHHSEGGTTTKKVKKSKKKTKVVSLPTNKTTCSKVRKAKFQEKTEEDMKCIFGFSVTTETAAASGDDTKQKAKRKSEDKEERKKKKQKS